MRKYWERFILRLKRKASVVSSDYEKSGNDYARWTYKAEELLIPSQILEESWLKSRKEENIPALANPYISTVILLRAMATELYLKSVYLKNGNKAVEDDVFVGPKTHDLVYLARRAAVGLTDAEKKVLKKLSEAITFWGRYPIPSSPRNWRKKVPDMSGIPPIFVWDQNEHDLCDTIIRRLIKESLVDESVRKLKLVKITLNADGDEL